MGSNRLLLIAVLCFGHAVKGGADKDPTSPSDAEGHYKDTGTEPFAAGDNEESRKLKRELSIVGPIPTSYRGQATGRTTYDGIQAGELQLPKVDAFGFGGNAQQPKPEFLGFRGEEQLSRSLPQSSPGFGGFSADSASDVYNFDGKEPVTYDGVLASDLMIPLPHVSRVNNPRPFTAPGISQQQKQTPAYFPQVSRQTDSTVDGIFQGDLTLPTAYTDKQIFSHESFSPTKPQLSNPTQFTAETPTERYNRLHEQYQAALEEYRNSLARFRQQLQKYATISGNNK